MLNMTRTKVPHFMRGRELSNLVVCLSFLLLRENKIAHSTVTGLPPLLEKVCYFCLVVFKEASVAQRANLVRKCLEKKRCLNSALKGQ